MEAVNWRFATGKDVIKWWNSLGGNGLEGIDGRLVDDYMKDGVTAAQWMCFLRQYTFSGKGVRYLAAAFHEELIALDPLLCEAELAAETSGDPLPMAALDYADLKEATDVPGYRPRLQRARAELEQWVEQRVVTSIFSGTGPTSSRTRKPRQNRPAPITRLDR